MIDSSEERKITKEKNRHRKKEIAKGEKEQ
jgi:hypothetical protein